MSGCEEVRDILVAEARGESVTSLGKRFLSEHVESCPDCRRRLANQQRLSGALAMVGSEASAPPAHLRAALMAEFQKQQKVTPIRRPILTWAAIAAVAAALLLAVFLNKDRQPSAATQPAQTKVEVPVVVQPAPVIAPPVQASQPVKVRRRPVARQVMAKAAPRTESDPEVVTDFFEIPYSEPLRPEERADVYRIQMPRANMAVFGLPVSGGRLDSRITADVLMGEDGVARAIRFIR